MSTIEEYAARWATTEYGAAKNENLGKRDFFHPMHDTIFEWAKADPESPIAKALASGADERELFVQFTKLWHQHRASLRRLDGKEDWFFYACS